MKVLTYTKDGWTEAHRCIEKPIRPAYNASTEEVQYANEWKLFNNHFRAIAAGSPQTETDNMPMLYRMLFQSCGEFFVSQTGIYRHISIDEQVFDLHECGTDDSDLSKEDKLFVPLDSIEEAKEDDEEELHYAILHAEQQRRRDVIIDDYANLIEEADENGDKELRNILITECSDEITNIPDDIDYQTSINSGFCADGYHGPKERVQIVDTAFNTSYTISAEKRKELFNDLFVEVQLCHSKVDLYGQPTKNEDGSLSWNNGLMNRIHELYEQDKIIKEKWNTENKEIARKKFISEWRSASKINPLKDEESLRIQLMFRFDNTEEEIPNTIIDNKVKYGKHIKKSLWDFNAQKDYMNLNLTSDQWSAIFKMKDIILARIAMNNNPTEDQNRVLGIMRDSFLSITTRQELKDHISMVLRREPIKKYKLIREYKEEKIYKDKPISILRKKLIAYDSNDFIPSMLDRISMNDEKNWRSAINKLAPKFVKKESE